MQVPFTDCGLDLGWSDPHAGPKQIWPSGDCYHQCCNTAAASIPTTPARTLPASPTPVPATPAASAVIFGRRHLLETNETVEAQAKADTDQVDVADVNEAKLLHVEPLPLQRAAQPCTETTKLFGPCEADKEIVLGIFKEEI